MQGPAYIRGKSFAQKAHAWAFIGKPACIARKREIALDAVRWGQPWTLEGDPIHLLIMKECLPATLRALDYTPGRWA
jgi:hypothetical protein